MKRIVGLKSSAKAAALPKKAPPQPQPGIDDIVQSTDRKVGVIEFQIAECDKELRRINQQMKALPIGISRQSLQTKARSILVRKKRYETQAEALREKSFNLDSLGTSISTAREMTVVASVMKSGTEDLKKQLKKVDLDKIEDFHEELSDLIEFTDDVQAAMSKSYGVPEDIDDDELNAQLELLGDEIIQDNDPSYIDAILKADPGSSMRPLSLRGDNNLAFPGAVDEFGLPVLQIPPPPNSQADKDNNAPASSHASSTNNSNLN